MSALRTTVRGLTYRRLAANRYECCRCRVVVDSIANYADGIRHVCIWQIGASLARFGGYDPNASQYEQYEALSLLFMELAVKAKAEAAEIEAERESEGAG